VEQEKKVYTDLKTLMIKAYRGRMDLIKKMVRDVVTPLAENTHIDATALIVMAAAQSGLLLEVAEALLMFSKHPDGRLRNDCPACALLEKLAEAFDDHTALAGSLVEDFYGEGVDASCGLENPDELRPYLGVKSNG
jgi:hypothetical protein